MANGWSVISQRQTTMNDPALGLIQVMEVKARTDAGVSFVVDVPILKYNADYVTQLLNDRAAHIDAVSSL